jgi:indole-3-pyruvate monooxygenase
MPVEETKALIIGASFSGLACAAALGCKNIDYRIIEKQDRAGAPWSQHYERVHLHTSKGISSLPYKKFDNSIGRYPSREQVIGYLEEYQRAFGINPIFHTRAISARRSDGYWWTETQTGSFRSEYLVMATGPFGKPKEVTFKGMESFPGQILHSFQYKTGRNFKGQRVLVVGFGNSACEIAIDLFEQGAYPVMSVRSPVNVIPRDVFGIPVLTLSRIMSPLPPRVADLLGAPLARWIVGDISKLGLKKMAYGPIEQVHRDASAPVLDIGTIGHIRKGHIRILGEMDQIEGNVVRFRDGRREEFDTIVACIGYSRDDLQILDVEKRRLDDLKVQISRQQYFGEDGLYFCGYWISPTGQIREIKMDALRIAKHLATLNGLSF